MEELEIKKINLNFKDISMKEFKKIVKSISNPKILTEKGGYLLQAIIENEILYLALQPSYINGQRTYHYDMVLPVESKISYSGGINIDETFSFMLIIDREIFLKGIGETIKQKLRANYVKVAKLLIINGFPDSFALDWGTKNIIEELSLFSKEIITLADLANYDM